MCKKKFESRAQEKYLVTLLTHRYNANIVLYNYASVWIRANDAYFVGEIYTLYDLGVWFFAGKGFLSIDRYNYAVRDDKVALILVWLHIILNLINISKPSQTSAIIVGTATIIHNVLEWVEQQGSPQTLMGSMRLKNPLLYVKLLIQYWRV